MKLTVFTSDGGEVEVGNFDANSALEMVEALRLQEEKFVLMELDGESTVLFNVEHIVRIDID